jgi:hypothetical protein
MASVLQCLFRTSHLDRFEHATKSNVMVLFIAMRNLINKPAGDGNAAVDMKQLYAALKLDAMDNRDYRLAEHFEQRFPEF